MFDRRASGILMPVFSLPSSEGIGTLGKNAYDFVDFLSDSHQTYWQVLPLGMTSFGDSPYQSFSSYAGNPYFIDLLELVNHGWLEKTEVLDTDWGSLSTIDYALLWQKKFRLLYRAFEKRGFDRTDVQYYCDQYWWLEDFSWFMALKHQFGGESRIKWKNFRIKSKIPSDLKRKIDKEFRFHVFLQAMFYEQWNKLKQYANNKGIKIIGDIPIFAAEDSADVWANPEIFQLDQYGKSTAVAGVPPDYFSASGQLWGNPLYDWDYLQSTGFSWWINRIKESQKLFDVIRIDHFRGFEAYWSIKVHARDASSGHWIKAPGCEFFRTLKHQLKTLNIIAEDLGIITDNVKELIEETGFPGMKVLLFAFNDDMANPYKPHNINKNSVVYTGTHDNETAAGWFLNPKNYQELQNAMNYFNIQDAIPETFAWKLVQAAFESQANLAIVPIQDILGLDNSARINEPSTVGKNWKWRLKALPSKSVALLLENLTRSTGRSTRMY